MRYFMDTEFIEDGKTIDLISIGMVAEDGRELYLCNKECDLDAASDWVRENVFPHLMPRNFRDPAWKFRDEIRDEIYKFVSGVEKTKPEFWGWYSSYDWVVLCQLWGLMIDLPAWWPKYCMDIKQWANMLGNPELPKQAEKEHHALADAKWVREAWLILDGYTIARSLVTMSGG